MPIGELKRRMSFREFQRWMQYFEERNEKDKPEFKEGSIDDAIFKRLNG